MNLHGDLRPEGLQNADLIRKHLLFLMDATWETENRVWCEKFIKLYYETWE